MCKTDMTVTIPIKETALFSVLFKQILVPKTEFLLEVFRKCVLLAQILILPGSKLLESLQRATKHDTNRMATIMTG